MDLLTFWPGAFWFLPPFLAVLLWIRFLSQRRQEILAGSLLLWKRLAAQQAVKPPRRLAFDRALLIQILAILALTLALANPRMAGGSAGGRSVVLAIDNGPLARFREANGAPLWNRVTAAARAQLDALRETDRVWLLRSSPAPLILGEVLTPAAARASLEKIAPALSSIDGNLFDVFAQNAARAANAGALRILSPAPAPTPSAAAHWIATGGTPRPNAGIVAFGMRNDSTTPDTIEKVQRTRALVRVHNAGDAPLDADLSLTRGGETLKVERIQAAAHADAVALFDLEPTAEALAIRLNSDDALPDDNDLLLSPLPQHRPRVRFHAAQPALEALFRIEATVLAANDAGTADLEVYVGAPPAEVPADSGAPLLVAPTGGYRFFFDVGDTLLEKPRVIVDEASPLTAHFATNESGLFFVPRAVELRRTGNFQSLLKDAVTQRTLAARFVDQARRPGYVLAFAPGAGASAEAKLPPELAALLLRMLREAAGAWEPYRVQRAADAEARSGEPAPPGAAGLAVLDEAVTSARTAEPGLTPAPAFSENASNAEATDLRPWLIALALALLILEFVLARKTARAALA
jgi:hypothetical protein